MSYKLRRVLAPYAFIVPAVLVLSVVFFYPMLRSLYVSFFDYDQLLGKFDFNGLTNYTALLRDPSFWNGVRASMVWTVGSVVGQLLFGFAFALVLNERWPGNRLVRALLLIPWVTPGVAIAIAWQWLYHPQLGAFNDILGRLGLPPQGWLGNPNLAMLSVIAPNIWKGFPFVTVTLLAGLAAIPKELYEAAEVDGASIPDRFRYITLPGLRYVIIVVLLLITIWTFNYFDLVFILTGGGPVNRTEILPILVYRYAFRNFRYGYAAAVAILIIIINLIFAVFYLRTLERQEG
jgi:multiple sugar transport system permease protein